MKSLDQWLRAPATNTKGPNNGAFCVGAYAFGEDCGDAWLTGRIFGHGWRVDIGYRVGGLAQTLKQH